VSVNDRERDIRDERARIILYRMLLLLAAFLIVGGPYGFIKSAVFHHEMHDVAAKVMTVLAFAALVCGFGLLVLALGALNRARRRLAMLQE
jgi:cation transporter-like permease